MTAPDDLDRTVDALKELLRVAWSDLANPALTQFERREARNLIKQYGDELRRYLKAIEAARDHDRQQTLAQQAGPNPAKPKLLLLA